MDNNNYTCEIINQKMWIKQNGEIWCYDILDLANEGIRRKKSVGSSADKILSLMPGKITKIFVKDGDLVKEGQTLVVMEAMKMEYTLKSSSAATVEKVFVNLNQQVSLSELLVQLNLIK